MPIGLGQSVGWRFNGAVLKLLSSIQMIAVWRWAGVTWPSKVGYAAIAGYAQSMPCGPNWQTVFSIEKGRMHRRIIGCTRYPSEEGAVLALAPFKATPCPSQPPAIDELKPTSSIHQNPQTWDITGHYTGTFPKPRRFNTCSNYLG